MRTRAWEIMFAIFSIVSSRASGPRAISKLVIGRPAHVTWEISPTGPKNVSSGMWRIKGYCREGQKPRSCCPPNIGNPGSWSCEALILPDERNLLARVIVCDGTASRTKSGVTIPRRGIAIASWWWAGRFVRRWRGGSRFVADRGIRRECSESWWRRWERRRGGWGALRRVAFELWRERVRFRWLAH